jgi:antitoxin (DNA-binding transcriptional repressor) of toxin-antitoxin stability system
MAAIALDERKAHPRDHDRWTAAGETVLVAEDGKLVTQLVPGPEPGLGGQGAGARCPPARDKRTLPTADRGAPPSPEGVSVNMEELLRTLDDRADQRQSTPTAPWCRRSS